MLSYGCSVRVISLWAISIAKFYIGMIPLIQILNVSRSGTPIVFWRLHERYYTIVDTSKTDLQTWSALPKQVLYIILKGCFCERKSLFSKLRATSLFVKSQRNCGLWIFFYCFLLGFELMRGFIAFACSCVIQHSRQLHPPYYHIFFK